MLLAAVLGISQSGELARAAGGASGPRVVAGSGSTRSGLFTAAPSGADFEFPSGARIHVAPGATVRISPASQALGLAPGSLTTTWSFALHEGRADIEMPRAGKSAVLVGFGKLNTFVTKGHVVCLARGNEFSVANVEGEVRTFLAEHWQTVPLGSVATLSRDNPTATAKPGLPAPKLTSGPRLFFAADADVAPSGFHWAAVPGAARYELRMRRISDGKVLEQRSVAEPELEGGFRPIAPGSYGLSLRSIDARGLESTWSPEAELRVIGVVLPPGGYSDERAIFLVPGQHVRFTHTSGLEMAYVGTGHYSAAAQTATLYRAVTTEVAFRLPGSSEPTIARLEPRDIYADVRVTPKRAVWPRDPVTIDIQLKSKTGARVPAFLRAVPHVTLGLEPLDVTFEREGNLLHAVIPPSRKPGPWVLRVDVADQFGVPLGRDFLEVAREPRTTPEPALKTPRPANVARGAVASSE